MLREKGPAKLRRVDKTEEEIDEEQMLFFEVPRKTCEQIAPGILRLANVSNKSQKQHRLHLISSMLRRARIKKPKEKIARVVDFDRSEKIVPHGEVSKRLYQDIFFLRDFDLYGRQIPKNHLSERKQDELKLLAQEIGIEFTRVQEQVIDPGVKVPNIFADVTEDLKVPVITTAPWKIGTEVLENAPPGFAQDPALVSRSRGNDLLYAYDGEWQGGMMNGTGMYRFIDGYTHHGQYKDNKANGFGHSQYPMEGSEYHGEWVDGKYSGKGKLQTTVGSQYDGGFRYGRMQGDGKLQLPCGLTYEGEWFDGKPHGRGTMKSSLTGYVFHGTFVRGSISGYGTLITPPPESEPIIRFWPDPPPNEIRWLPGLVKFYIKEKEEERQRLENQKNFYFNALRGRQMRDYVNTVRSNLHSERLREKKERFQEQLKKVKEQKEKLYQARLRALADE